MENIFSASNRTCHDSAVLDACLEKIASGDMQALEELYHRTHRTVYAFALSLLKNTHDGEDVLHDCYVSIASSAAGYRSHGKPLAWILTIARNLCMLKFREYRLTAELPDEDWQHSIAADAGYLRSEYEYTRGTIAYEVEFTAGGYEYTLSV